MISTDFVALSVALVLGVFTALRTPSALRGHNVPLWIAHALIVVCLLLAVTPVYVVIDRMAGGSNVANLVSHLLFNLVFLFGCRQVAQSVVRPDLVHRVCWRPGFALMVFTSLLVAGCFVLADTPVTSMGLNLYRDDPWVVAYKAASFVYPAYCSAVLVPMLVREARSTGFPLIHGAAKGFLALGFALMIPLPAIHLLEFAAEAARVWVDVFLYTAILLVSAGPLLAFIARIRRSQGNIKLAA